MERAAAKTLTNDAPVLEAVLEAARRSRDETARLDPGPKVAHVYHPLQYAWPVHEAFLRRYAATPKRALLVGMNPGPWGMGQIGVPFGTVEIAARWLRLEGIPIDHEPATHPKRPILGWACTRQEVSGQRLWGFLRDTFDDAERALRDLGIVNHCPLLMFDPDGRNVTPDKLGKGHKERVYEVCDAGVARMAQATRATALIGIGAYAHARCQAIVDSLGLTMNVDTIPHPSPASPLANKDGGRHWREAVTATLQRVGVLDP